MPSAIARETRNRIQKKTADHCITITLCYLMRGLYPQDRNNRETLDRIEEVKALSEDCSITITILLSWVLSPKIAKQQTKPPEMPHDPPLKYP